MDGLGWVGKDVECDGRGGGWWLEGGEETGKAKEGGRSGVKGRIIRVIHASAHEEEEDM